MVKEKEEIIKTRMPEHTHTRNKNLSAWKGICANCGKYDSIGVMMGSGKNRKFCCGKCVNKDKERIGELKHYEEERAAHDKPVDIVISTKVPCKWRFVDLECNKTWMYDEETNMFKEDNDFGVVEVDEMEEEEE